MSKKWMGAVAFASLVLVVVPGQCQEPSRGTGVPRERIIRSGGTGHWVEREPPAFTEVTRSTSISGNIEGLEIPICRNNSVDRNPEEVPFPLDSIKRLGTITGDYADVVGKLLVSEPVKRPPNTVPDVVWVCIQKDTPIYLKVNGAKKKKLTFADLKLDQKVEAIFAHPVLKSPPYFCKTLASEVIVFDEIADDPVKPPSIMLRPGHVFGKVISLRGSAITGHCTVLVDEGNKGLIDLSVAPETIINRRTKEGVFKASLREIKIGDSVAVNVKDGRILMIYPATATAELLEIDTEWINQKKQQ